MAFYNPETNEDFMDEKIINGNPSGVINPNKTKYPWAKSLYELMQSYTWFKKECFVSMDKVPYRNLTNNQKKAYNLALAQLIVNDSVQTKQLVNGISEYITSPMICNCLTRQGYEEIEHALTYGAIADEVIEDSDLIYYLHKTDKMLAKKNLAVRDMYEVVQPEYSDKPSVSELQLAAVANQILEELIFPGGFAVLWSFNFPGTNKAIQFIERDETGTHVPLFKNIFNTMVRENGITEETKQKAIDLIIKMTEIEKEWTKYISGDLLGFSETAVDMYIEEKANSVCRNLRLPLQYTETNGGPIMRIIEERSLLKGADVKTNFFETAVGDYDVGGLDEDY